MVACETWEEVTMVQAKRNRSAFTLIELLVVVIIVAVLASVGIPLLSANVQRARASEAEAGLGTIRTGVRAFLAENGTFPGASLTLAQAGLQAGDLNGRWFNDAAYTGIATTASTTTYCISVTGASSTAPKASQVQAPTLIARSMNQDGTIGSAVCSGVAVGGTVLN